MDFAFLARKLLVGITLLSQIICATGSGIVKKVSEAFYDKEILGTCSVSIFITPVHDYVNVKLSLVSIFLGD